MNNRECPSNGRMIGTFPVKASHSQKEFCGHHDVEKFYAEH